MYGPHESCRQHPTFLQGEEQLRSPVACQTCLLLHILERIEAMPTLTDLTSATAAVQQTVTEGFAALVTAINDSKTNAIPQSAIDGVTNLGSTVQAGLAAATAAVSSAST